MELNDQDRALHAEHVLQFPYRRATGPILGRFFTEIRDHQRLLGVKTASQGVLCPPVDVDPDTLEDLSVDDLVEVGPAGRVTTWTWLEEPRPGNPLERAFAWALIQLNGADSAILHAVDVGNESAMKTGMRVVPRFRDALKGDINDIVCFVPEDSTLQTEKLSVSQSQKPVNNIKTPIAVHYDYSVGAATSAFLRALREGRILGSRCPDTGKVYVPPRLFSVETSSPMNELVEIPDRGVLCTYCIVNIQFYEQVLEVPYAYGYVLLDGTDLPIMHLIQECPIDEIRSGMRVEAAWKAPGERSESLENIRYFKPTGEADVPIKRIMEEIREKSHA